MSLICPWDCSICCVDAVHVANTNSLVTLKSNNLKVVQNFNNNGTSSIYDQAVEKRQSEGLELNLEQKIRVLNNLGSNDIKIDFSGGDPLVVAENVEVIREASRRFGKDSIHISTTGAGLSKYKPEEIAPFIGQLNFSYDASNGVYNPNRPERYNNTNLKKAGAFAEANVLTRAETPLSVRNIEPQNLQLIYENLNRAGTHRVLIMRLFLVGRGIDKLKEIPTRDQYVRAIEIFKELESKYGKPSVILQCALKHLYSQDTDVNPCDLFRESFAITANGLLITSAWAVGHNEQPLDNAFVLGNIAKDHIDNILNSQKARYYQEHVNDNFGHCKIFAFFNSGRDKPIDRIFDKTDPLYTQNN